MARKASDLFTLLQSRGGGRGASGRPGILGQVTGWLNGLFGSSKRRYHDGGGRRAMQFSSTALLGIVFASLGVGYLLGDAFPLAGRAALRRGPPQDPGPVRPHVIKTGVEAFRLDATEECKPVSKQAYIAAWYGGDTEGERSSASALALQLRAEGLETARPFRVWNGEASNWAVMAYFEGSDAAAEVRKKIVSVAAGYPELMAVRKLLEAKNKDWPLAYQLP